MAFMLEKILPVPRKNSHMANRLLGNMELEYANGVNELYKKIYFNNYCFHGWHCLSSFNISRF